MTRKKPGKVGENKSDIVREVPLACADERAAVEFIEKRRWGSKPRCACCDSENVYQMKDRKTGERNKDHRWRCRDCGKLYSVRKGTVFEDSRIPMRHWCFAFWAACSSKKGVSAKQIQRQTGLSYKSALFMMHRIRFAMSDGGTPPKLTGTVEADETYVGGKTRRRVSQERRRQARLRGEPIKWHDKTPVVAMVQRGGEVRAEVIQSVTAANLREVLIRNVDLSSRLMTDEMPKYKKIGKPFASHERVNHSKKEYARGHVTTNTVEGFFALLKRGMYGTFHAVSKKHLHRYVDEFVFRYNYRKVDDGARTETALQGAVGKRLTYKPVSKGA